MKAMLLLLILFISCNKEKVQNTNYSSTSISENFNKAAIATDSKYASTSANLNSSYSSIKEIIKAYAKKPSVEVDAIARVRNTKSDSVNIVSMNNAVANYLQKYPAVGYIDPFYARDPNFVMVTLVYAYLEGSGALGNISAAQNYVPVWIDCIVSSTLGYFDVRELIKDLGTFEFGTVWRVVKFAIKKYVGWVGAALLIYHIATDCF